MTFTLSGSLHVGSGRWGFVLPCRPYVPGWTLWGALVVLLKKTGRWSGGYGEIGQAVNEHCWLGHLFLETEMGDDTYRYLPAVDQDKGGKTMFAWRDNLGQPTDLLLPPTLFRHGVVRSHEQDQNSLGRLFLTESVQARQDAPYRLSGIFRYDGAKKDLPFQERDRLRIGGNRQVSGAEITCRTVQTLDDNDENEVEKNNLLHLQHLRFDPTNRSPTLTGELERIVLRRTRSACGDTSKGFGQHFLDWGNHLAPGWQGLREQRYKPILDKKGESRHGTVQCIPLVMVD
ncbi:MAG: hypothetical protein D3922_03490 [Candidatus Electrothrix sp. AR1]|nr:hypothetical protein [Candidatus Electrothrix sp. AR1]